MRLTTLLLACLLWGCAPGGDSQAPAPAPEAAPRPEAAGPLISGAWVRAMPPAARMTAGYLTLYNPGPGAIVVVGAESPQFGSIEMHGTELVDGVARMRQRHEITVAAGETVSFEPGGLHLMLMQPHNGAASSGEVELALMLEDGRRLTFSAAVGQAGN